MNATIVLTKEEIEDFKVFLKYRDIFRILDDQKALDIRFGKCTLNFAFGELQTVVKEEALYKRM